MSSGFHDNSANVINSVNGAMKKALVKIGEAASELIQDQMDLGYGRPIWLTGDLHRDVQYKYDSASGTVMVGNSLEYAPFVHEGTYKMRARPYIRDTLMDGSVQKALRQVAEEQLGQLSR